MGRAWHPNRLFGALLIALTLASSAPGEGLAPAGRLVFAGNLNGNWDLFTLKGDAQPAQLTNRSGLDARAPVISPDGQQVAYATSDGAIRVIVLATKVSRKVTLATGVYGYPSWGADGNSLVVTRYRYKPPDEDADLITYSFKDGKESVLLTQTGPQDFPAVSPSGDRIAYMSSLATHIPGFGAHVTQQLWVASLRTGAVRQLLAGVNVTSRPAWSPDGKSLAFSSDHGGSTEIWIVDSEGATPPVELTSGPGQKSSPTWSPDGSEIAYVSTIEGIGELTVIHVASKEVRKLHPFGSRKVSIRDPHWR